MQKIKDNQTFAFDLQGHRGCRGLMPENTIPAMLKAIELGVTTLEMDVVITNDGHVLLSHDPFFNHEITTKPDGSYVSQHEEKGLNIYNMTYLEVEQFDVGLKINPHFLHQQKIRVSKPLLSTLIDNVEFYISSQKLRPVYYNIETKCLPATDDLNHPQPNQFVELLMNVILAKGIEQKVIIQSFDFRTLQYLHQKYPVIKIAMLIEDFDKRNLEDQITALGFLPHIYSPHYSLVTKSLIECCHQKGIKVIPWTVNDVTIMRRLKKMGVDGLISDYPNLYKEL